jgi:hypothetical protein
MTSSTGRPVLQTAACAAVIALTAAPAIALAARPATPFAVAAVFPPWWSAERVRAAVEPVGEISSTGRAATVVSVLGGADLAERLRSAGAWLILNPELVGCATRPGAEA